MYSRTDVAAYTYVAAVENNRPGQNYEYGVSAGTAEVFFLLL